MWNPESNDSILTSSERIYAKLKRLNVKADFYREVIKAKLRTPELAIIGCYNTSNVGDLAMGWSIAKVAQSYGFNVSLQSYSGWSKFPDVEKAIIGGGDIIASRTPSHLSAFVNRRQKHVSETSIVSVSGALHDNECTEEELVFLQSVPFISARSRRFRDDLSKLISREVCYYPDAAFALPQDNQFNSQRQVMGPPTLGINVMPHFWAVEQKRYIPGELSEWFLKHFPEFSETHKRIAVNYIEAIRAAIRAAHAIGYRVRILPFSIEDEVFCHSLLRDLPVEFEPFANNPLCLMRSVSACTRIIATRYHAHIFALSLGVPLMSISYYPKCSDLWVDLELPMEAQIDLSMLALDSNSIVDQLLHSQPACLPNEQINHIRNQARQGILQALKAVFPDRIQNGNL